MGKYTAVKRTSCPACGAAAEWDAGEQALVCGYCGTLAPYELDADSGQVREIDLVRTLRELGPELRGWKADKRSVKCQSCDAISVFDPERVGQNCDFCGSPQLIDYEELQPPIRPQSVLPFRVEETRVREQMRSWYRKRWFAPGKLKSKALVDRVHGVYVPYWTFDAQTRCEWSAQSGTYHYTTQSYRDSKGRNRTRRVRHVRWRPVSGRIEHVFDDRLVAGTRGLQADLLRRIEPFPTGEAVPYDAAYLSGFVVEHYQVVLFDAARQARESMLADLRGLCAGQVPGDTQRGLQISPEFSGETFKLVLVPVWLLSYDYGSRKFQVQVNGSTGAIAGHYPKSMTKILLLVAGMVLVALALLLLR